MKRIDITPDSSTDATLKRTRAKEAVVFKKPYVGPSGAELIGYEWSWKPEEYIDKWGDDKVKRISDWSNSITNEETGRDIVHQFVIQPKNGEEQTVSAESAAKLLGVTQGTVRINARKLLADTIKKQKHEAAAAAYIRKVRTLSSASPALAINREIQERESKGIFTRNLVSARDWAKAPDKQTREYNGSEKSYFIEWSGGFFSPVEHDYSEKLPQGMRIVTLDNQVAFPERVS